MIELTLAQLAEVTGGTVWHADPAVAVTAPAAVDSRAVEPGGLFVAVVGEHVDGHDFAARAVASGAAAALVSKDVGAACIVVDDPVRALGLVAREVVSRLPECTVIGLTGSQGKTGTKDMLEQILARAGETVATAGNFNNEIGVPLTVLRVTVQTRFLVVEMGARGVGNIDYVCQVAHPSIGAVLNVGVAHIGEFGSRANIARAKAELVEALPADGRAVLNADDDAVAAMAGRTAAQVLTFGRSAAADVRMCSVEVDGNGEPGFDLEHEGEREHVHVPLLGEHQAYNAAAAATVALAVGLDLVTVALTLGSLEVQSSWRMERHRRTDGVVVVNDAYNANPDSMRAALTTLASVEAREARRIAVIGEMLELGDAAVSEHEAVGRLAADLGIDQVVVVGRGAAGVHDGVQAASGHGTRSIRVEDVDAASAWAGQHVRPGDVVLVKASRASGLERVAAGLLGAAGHNASGSRHGDEGSDAR